VAPKSSTTTVAWATIYGPNHTDRSVPFAEAQRGLPRGLARNELILKKYLTETQVVRQQPWFVETKMSTDDLLFNIAEWTINASVNPMLPLFVIGVLVIPSFMLWDKLRVWRKRKTPLSPI
jgi:hypothetical protein